MNKADKVIIAFDLPERQGFATLLEQVGDKATYIKIGMESFYSLGPWALAQAKEAGLKVFLDLKLHDIPNTVGKSVYSLCRHGANMINVHALGGLEMMKAAKEAVDLAYADLNLSERPKLISVTHLTSLDQKNLEEELGIAKNLKASVVHLARLSKKAGLDGVVCSAHEAQDIKKACGESFITVTPGIRTKDSSKDDQKRVMTPPEAVAAGSDYMVIGRSITKASDPGAAFEDILEQI